MIVHLFSKTTFFFRAILNGYLSIKAGESQIIVAVGQENMSLAPHVSYLRNGIKLGDGNLIDTLVFDGLTDAFHGIHMGITGNKRTVSRIILLLVLYTHIYQCIIFFLAENVSKDFSVSRKEQDDYAVMSQKRAETAITAGYFKKEIVPITVPNKKGSIIVDKDEFPKFGTTVEDLQKLKPVFLKV